MKKFLLLFYAGMMISIMASAQGTIRGKITDETGESVIGVAIVLKSNPSYGVTTDLDGNYSLKINDTTPQVLVISFISYETIEDTVQPKNKEILIRNYLMRTASRSLNQVEITAKAVKARDSYVETMKKNNAVTIDYVSSETMKKVGDNNATAAIARVSGISVTNGFVTVRGIGDRYVKTAINGSRIPTLDPFTNNIKLDIFPASLIDNIIVSKTASPDLPGDWAGAYISVETKDYPEELAINIESTVGYNVQSTFKDMVTSQHSSTDWLGYDKNFRDHDHGSFETTYIKPTQYQEFVALGLGEYYHSMGVNQENWGEGTAKGELYFALGLVQLGLLAPALINDKPAVAQATNEYIYGNYKTQAYNVINGNVPASAKSFPNNWNTSLKQAPLNFSQSLSIGNQTRIFGKQLGFILGFRYGSNAIYDPDAVANRAGALKDTNGNVTPTISAALQQQSNFESNGWSGLANLALKLDPNNSISFLYMPNFYGVNKVRNAIDISDPNTHVLSRAQFYEQRKQLVYQLKSEHYLPGSKIRVDFNASYTDGKSSAPDFKNVQYWYLPGDSTYQIGGTIGDGIHRYYRYLTEKLFDSRLAAEFPLSSKPGLPRKFRLGGAYQTNNKTSDQYDYFMLFGDKAGVLTNNDLDTYFSLSNFDIQNGVDNLGVPYSTMNFYYVESGSAGNHTFGNSHVTAGFMMLDYTLIPRLRLSGGLRVEKAYILTDIVKYHELGLAPNDPRRRYDPIQPLANPGELNETSYLPSANLIYKLKDSEEAPVNLRLNYSRSVARPSIRELSDLALYDYEFRTFVFGNSDLQMVSIDNYDVRLESWFKSGDNISGSIFYKNFKNHIELINSGSYTWQNVDKSYVVGIELEGKKKLGKNFEFRANVTLVNSRTEYTRTRMEIVENVKTYIPLDDVKRTMYGQAPYVVNGILNYTSDSIGLSLTVSYNIQGPRLYAASDNPDIPDVYELPRNMLDFKAAKKLGKHFLVSLTVRNILDAPVRKSYKYPEGYTLDYDYYQTGSIFELAVAYKF